MIQHEETHVEVRRSYLFVYIFLAVFTGIEIGTSYLAPLIRIPVLLLLAAIKAALVLLYFMHLRSDSRLYTMLFAIGLVLIIPLSLIMILVMPNLSYTLLH